MAKVLLVNPVVREEDIPRHIPYGISLLASIAMKKGHLVQIYDANAWRKGFDVLEKVFRADDWDVIAIGGLTTTYRFIKKAFQLAKKNSPKSILMAGGGFITSMPQDIMGWIPEIDLGLVGEAFVTFPEVLDKIDRQDFNFSSTTGVVFRHKNGKSYLTPAKPVIKNLDDLPYPAWDLLPLDIYFKNSANLFSEESFTAKRRMDVNGSLGCGLVCKYCWHLGTTGDMIVEEDKAGENQVVFTYGRNIRYHSPSYIVNMVKHLYEVYNIDFASFIDENLMTMDAASRGIWLNEICDLWKEKGLQPTCRQKNIPHDEDCRGVHWNGTSHAGLHKFETLKRMHEAGCTHLVYGLESFDPNILKNLGKGSTAARNKSSVGICLSSGIKPIPNIILGFPEETFDSIKNTITAMKELGITAKPHFATAYPGSEWYYSYKNSIIEQYEGDLEKYIAELGDASSISATISHHFTGVELIGLQEIIYKKDLRLLALAEKNWHRNRKQEQINYPQDSINFKSKSVRGPMEAEGRTF